MDIEQIRELVRLMVENQLSEMDLTFGENKIKLRKGGEVVAMPAMAMASPAPAAAPPPAAPAAPKENLLEIRSPMVGTFYAAPSPTSDPFISVGAHVSDNTVACIIEAMKVMNEIKAELSGQVVEVCVKNAQPVEYGQVLFKVRPA